MRSEFGWERNIVLIVKRNLLKMETKYSWNNFGGLDGEDIATPIGRLAFVYLTKPNARFEPPKYTITILFKKDDETTKPGLKKLQAACNDMIDYFARKHYSKVNSKAIAFPAFKESISAKMAGRPFLQNGDEKPYDGFKDHWYLVAKVDKIERVKTYDNVPLEKFEAGMLAAAQVQIYLDDKGFAYRLHGLRLIKDDGVRFKTGAPRGDSLLGDIDDAEYASNANVESAQGLEAAYDAAIASNATAKPVAASRLDIL